MKVLLYIGKGKGENNFGGYAPEKIFSELGVEYSIIDENALNCGENEDYRGKYAAIFVYGGDGTILRTVDFSAKTEIPIVGVNVGKLGFLSEFERSEVCDAINLLKNNALKKDERVTLSVKFNENNWTALNDVVVQRVNCEGNSGIIVYLSAYIDDNLVDKIAGDGIIISTPTGSTAYSLSAGGSILAPGIGAFQLTPICAHSFNNRPLVFSSDSVCKIQLKDGCDAGLIVDGKEVDILKKGNEINVSKSDKSVVFLRKPSFDFYDRLSQKIKKGSNR